ncbi:MAG: bifunctional hydroxymethylpyrimidine kinase/phosphomethylpyrimidine kinase [Hyphomicrobiaceae bacterium]|nr:bifunctional hydroxymethylpyrimidine kinase/phosphomethylpyrimidine kinase [Hyphomicrobiaceae bacterium]
MDETALEPSCPEAPQPPVALSIAGSDPSGGAGIQADLKTFAAFGVYGAAAITALTAQNTQGVSGVMPVNPDFVGQQIEAVASDISVQATKIGMLANVGIIQAVVGCIRGGRLGRIILDPVMIATSGDALIDPAAVAALRRDLLPLSDLVTPNLAEAARLLETAEARDLVELEQQARAILALGTQAVLIKGGHRPTDASTDAAVDLLVTRQGARVFVLPRIATANTHGTGCTLSAAIAAACASGLPLASAIAQAKSYVHCGLAAARNWRLGAGHGPLDHRAGALRVYSRLETGDKALPEA